MKNIKDYLHLYLGCAFFYLHSDDESGEYLQSGFRLQPSMLERQYNGDTNYKPILRPLSDMTEEEIDEHDNLYDISWFNGTWAQKVSQEAAAMHYLLSKHFDLFGLIDAGLAIDKTKL